jgi:glycosyltransferase 2 family protein
MSGHRKKLILILKIGISSLFLGYLCFRVNWQTLSSALFKINIVYYLISMIVAIAASGIVALKYHLLIRKTPISLPVRTLLKINLISRYYALLLPSAVGVEAVRWLKVTNNRGSKALFTASSFFERFSFLSVLLFAGTIPLFFSVKPEIIILRKQLLPLTIMMFAGIFTGIAFILSKNLQEYLRALLKLEKWPKLNSFLQNFSLRKKSKTLYANIYLLSIIWQILFVFRLILLFKSACFSLGIWDITWMGSLVLLLQIIPLSFAGIGIREGAYAYLFTLFKLPSEDGILIGILFFSQMLIFAVIGAVLEWTRGKIPA